MSKKKNKNFTMVPNKLVRSPEISPNAFRLYVCLKSYNPSFPSYRSIKESLGSSSSTIRKSIIELQEKKIIKYTKGYSYKRANEYFFLPENKWKLETTSKKKDVQKSKHSNNQGHTALKNEDELLQKPKNKKTNTRKTIKESEESHSLSSSSEKDSERRRKAESLYKIFKNAYKKHKKTKYKSVDSRDIKIIEDQLEAGHSFSDLKWTLKNIFIHERLNQYSSNLQFFLTKTDIINQLTDTSEFPGVSDYDKKCKKKGKIILTKKDKELDHESNDFFQDMKRKVKKEISSLYETLYVVKMCEFHSIEGSFQEDLPLPVLLRLQQHKKEKAKLKWNKNLDWFKPYKDL